jgi:hypothetical protein
MANEILVYALAVLCGLGAGMIITEALFGTTSWRRIRKRLACFFGQHAPDTVRPEAGYLVRRCLYCDRVVNKFIQDDNKIRRIH